LLVLAFLVLGYAFWTNNLGFLPFSEELDRAKTVEIGLGILGVTISAGTVAALTLIKSGTQRWATNRRIAELHLVAAEALAHTLRKQAFDEGEAREIISAYLRSIDPIYGGMNGTHETVQRIFENLRYRSFRGLEAKSIRLENAREIASEMYAIAIVSDLEVSSLCRDAEIVKRISQKISPFKFTSEGPLRDA